MSRRADDCSFPDVASQSSPSDVGRRTSAKSNLKPLKNVRAEGARVAQIGDPQDVARDTAGAHQGGVTREEMVRLFGSALRVR